MPHFTAIRTFSGRWLRGAVAALVALAVPGSVQAETLNERWQRLEHLTPVEKEALKEKQDRFLALSAGEQDRLRVLQQQIAADPAATRLLQVATRYAEWLKTLGASERSELLALPTDRRVAKIKELVARQQAKQFQRLVEKKLPQEDLDAIFAWLERLVHEHEAEILAALPADRRQRLESVTDEKVRQRMLLMFGGPVLREKMPQPVWQASFEELAQHLSPEAKKALADLRDPKEKGRLVQGWVWAAMLSRIQVDADPAELRKLLQSPLISPEQREFLEGLPPERMQQELKRLYMWSRMVPEGGREGPFFRPGMPGGSGPVFRPFRGGPGGGPGGPGEPRGPESGPSGPGELRGPRGFRPGGEGRPPEGAPPGPPREEPPPNE